MKSTPFSTSVLWFFFRVRRNAIICSLKWYISKIKIADLFYLVDLIYWSILYLNICNNSGKDYNMIYELTFAGTRESPQSELTKQSAKMDSAHSLLNLLTFSHRWSCSWHYTGRRSNGSWMAGRVPRSLLCGGRH